ncbi:P-loop containing nucleoside triphosphate hydrolase protein [Gigaspora rosea]|uniref:P-loop containing nucleoside triphosphate hydrolase protein n=1 Tax=Gigaspora rosea TaxID=44941 RepID=A0A397UPA5_9GLOM|nr:P-loop containing nucleoside triphosphate hydrolase protein [Gigaspora rosea]
MEAEPSRSEITEINSTLSDATSPPLVTGRARSILHIECCLKTLSTVRYEVIREQVEKFLREFKTSLLCHSEISDFQDVALLKENVEYMIVAEAGCDTSEIQILENVDLNIHVYQLNEDDVVEEYQEEENVLTANYWDLPARALDGLWDNLIFDENIKIRLLDYVYTTILFADRNVNSNIISWNRIILLHGPPGTGKTTLCRAFAQKLSIRLAERYSHGKLFEINSHSLFSKWFSESGKLVQKLFQQIYDLIDDDDAFVCILIDEVESLAATRKTALSGAEPLDAVRVVNALLTQIDKLKQEKNVLILTTSNITEAIDIAFIDRADIKQYIGLPSQQAIYGILSSCIRELMRVKIIVEEEFLLDWRAVELYQHTNSIDDPSIRLYAICGKCQATYAQFLKSWATTTLKDFLKALEHAVDNEIIGRKLTLENQGEGGTCKMLINERN